MKKSFLALAVFAACATIAGSAAAQSSVTIYGVVDAGIDHQTGGINGAVTKLSSGMQNSNRIGFKGVEDLGGGTSALFVLENGFGVDTGSALQGGALFGRQAFVGLKSNLGALTMGRQYTPIFGALCGELDPFSCGLAGNAANLMSQGGTPTGGGNAARTNNSVKYATPLLDGFNADVTYGFGEVAGNTSAARTVGAQLGYTNGKLTLRLAHNNVNDITASTSAKTTVLGGKYNCGAATVHLAYAINKGAYTGNTNVRLADSRDVLLGVSMPFGAGTFLASYIRKSDKAAANNDANQIALGYTYALSKRTNLYTSYARIDNTVANTVGSAGGFYTVGNATEGGSGDRAFNVGVRHTF